MSVRQYETFLAQSFLEWVDNFIQLGERYQFKSPDADNALKLYQAFVALSDGHTFELPSDDQQTKQLAPCIHCRDGIQLIPVLQGEGDLAFTENYISHLRDRVSGRDNSFDKSVLLIIHNSMLDTLLNSTKDLAAPEAIWHPETFSKKIEALIAPGNKGYELSRCLLDDQLEMILEEGATIFGFAPLYRSLENGLLEFSELGLFNDPTITSMDITQGQIQNRLDENRKLYSSIKDSVERYGDQLESVLTEFSTKFIQEHFEEKNDWQSLDFSVYLQEKKDCQVQSLLFETVIASTDTIVWQRTKSETKAGQKDISVLVQAPVSQQFVELDFSFLGNDLQDNQIKITHNRTLKKQQIWSINRAGRKYSRMKVMIPFDGHPNFLSLELINRGNRTEEYKFRILVIEQNSFYLDEIKNYYRIEPGKLQVTLQLEENQLRIAQNGDDIYSLEGDEDEVDIHKCSLVDFETLANQSELIKFKLVSGGNWLTINVEGPGAEEKITLPLLFDQSRFAKLLKEEGNAEYNRTKRRVIFDNIEHTIVGVRMQLLGMEVKMVDEGLLYVSASGEVYDLDKLRTVNIDLHDAYRALFIYYQQRKTLPSLVSWSDEYCCLVAAVLNAFEIALSDISLSKVLNDGEKCLLRLGIYCNENDERLSPLHPLVLSYHLQLVEECDDSFSELPEVTLDRLVASGLMPFVYHSEHEFAQLQSVKENRFWIDVIPQRRVNHSYVKYLVRNKLNEFTDAYSRLFSGVGNSALVINAINQGVAKELFLGLVDYFKQKKENATAIHVNFYDEQLMQNDFDRFAEMGTYDDLKNWLGLKREDADLLIDLIRSRLTFSKFSISADNENLAYAHLAFFKNSTPVDCRTVNMNEALSGVLCNGLLAGEGAETLEGAYFTAFGLRHVDVKPYRSLRIARLLGILWQPARQSNTQFLGHGIGLAVSANFKHLLERSYNSALWTTVIDPKVTLDFFTSQKDVVLIHYSDQYTSCTGYDAVTVTKQVDLFQRLLSMENSSGQGYRVGSDRLLSEFNAFNGEWLLKMLRSTDKDRKEKHGIIGAYKFVQSMLRRSDICWIPLSVAEMIRVSGNIGLKMSESEFSRNLQGYHKGAISDDVLFVGFKGDKLYLLPLEVKTGARPDYRYAGQQASELKRYLQEDLLGKDTMAARLYRALFVRQVLMQVEKLHLYQVLDSKMLEPLLSQREWWLTGNYQLGQLNDYVDGIVLAHVDSSSCFEPSYKITEKQILQIELPYALLSSLIAADCAAKLDELVTNCNVPERYMLIISVDKEQTDVADIIDVPDTQSEVIVEFDKSVATSTTDVDVSSSAPTVENKIPLQVLFGHESLRQTPLYWEPTNTAKFMNTNTGIIGTMGTGKTQFTKSLVTQLIRNQINNVNEAPIGLLIFDYKSDYVDEAFLTATGAKKYKLFKLPYNPLSLFGDTPMLPIHTAGGFAETMSRAYGLGHKQQLKLENLILECYDASGISPEDSSTWGRTAPTIEDVWQRFLAQEKVEEDSLYAALSKLARYKIFETVPNYMVSLYELIDGVTVIELAGYPSEIQNLVVALTLDLFYAQMQKRGKPAVIGDYRQITKMVLVDEADNFMRQDFPSLRKILKEGREYGVGMILSTQEITHFKTGENNYSSYILTWIIHRVAEIKNADIKAVFNVDDKGEQELLMEKIRCLDKHFSLYIDGNKKIQKMRDKAFWELI
ncbi:DNA phosphorothioation-dependent restriction protein DptH [Xenorhabdus bovienii]|uniref:DNA phosphorothioation-dependent restriction protein DptH n=1 Tax=Xenorhabdus bovienii TaxID=40576 RepID=UPI0023B26BA1|nr:DNA phosphorothioation-dependent restriction protein DptH [Xenorhabdus bovienii]MDE9456761.1 DNA phosphorothioation-dependent restriction protein DptH [Xenorhabdus bovienii]MDE9513332.1 DNA phosphorothioation-dependent restriction protein DptH [Xenorhabdus bovienii]